MKNTVCLIRVPVSLGATLSVHQILNCQPVKFLMVSQYSDDVPTQAIDIDPTTRDPGFLWLIQKFFQIPIIQIGAIDSLLFSLSILSGFFILTKSKNVISGA